MQKQLIKYGFMAFSSVFLSINTIRAASDPCAEGSTCVWSLDDDGNLTITSGTYKDWAFSNQTFNSVTIAGDAISLNGAFRSSKTGDVNILGKEISLGGYSFASAVVKDVKVSVDTLFSDWGLFNGSQVDSIDIAKGNISNAYHFLHDATLGDFTISGDNVTIQAGGESFSGATLENIKILGNDVTLSHFFQNATVDDITILGNGLSTEHSFKGIKADNVLISGNDGLFKSYSFSNNGRDRTEIDNFTIIGDGVFFSNGLEGADIEKVVLAGTGIRLDGWAFDGNVGDVIISEGSMPTIKEYHCKSDTTFICSEADKETCYNISNYYTKEKPKVETYTYDEKTGFYNYKHKRYKDPRNIATGDYVPRRIYTLEEALEVAGDKGNKFMLRYK